MQQHTPIDGLSVVNGHTSSVSFVGVGRGGRFDDAFFEVVLDFCQIKKYKLNLNMIIRTAIDPPSKMGLARNTRPSNRVKATGAQGFRIS